jgi:adenosine kinase
VLDIPSVKPAALVDPTGCGDAYRAGLLYGIAHGWDWQQTGRLASLLGSLKIASRGGQNHVIDQETIAARYAEEFGASPW